MQHPIVVRRVYDEPEAGTAARILVDRLWPRGLSKEKARLDEWCRDVAPSAELRKWYGHDASRFDEFARRYRAELADDDHGPAVAHLKELADGRGVMLLTATREVEISGAAVLGEVLRGGAGGRGGRRPPPGR